MLKAYYEMNFGDTSTSKRCQLAHQLYTFVAGFTRYNLKTVYGHGDLAHHNMYNLPSRMLRHMLEVQELPLEDTIEGRNTTHDKLQARVGCIA